jgi:serine/threonine protein kinase
MKAQEWLEKNYPDQKTRTIYLNQQLEGVLDCREYKNLWKISISSSVDSSKLEIKKGSYYYGEVNKTNIILCLPAQTWLDQNYPQNGTCQIENESDHINNFDKTREEIKELNISYKALEGTLDLTDFKNLEILFCSDNCLANLNLNNCQKLKKIYCKNNQLTTLNLSNLKELEKLDCSDNYLTQIPYFPQPEKIKELWVGDNNLSPSKLTIFSQLRNLESLGIGNRDKKKINQNVYNRLVGSCEPLKDLNKLKWLSISNTDLDSGWEYLPDSLTVFYYDTQLRPNCKLSQNKVELEKELWIDIHQEFIFVNSLSRKGWLTTGFSKEKTKKIFEKGSSVGIRPQEGAFINWFLNFKKLDLTWACENEEEFKDLRDKYKYFGTCEECQQPNTSEKWCQSCNAQHFQSEFNTWTSGNPRIDNFIQQCQLEATSAWNILEWIPYEKFWKIEHIADGGFGKVEKTKWEGGSIEWWGNKSKEWKRNNYDKTVALKTLFNSQNLNQNFLQELVIYKAFKSSVSQMVPCYGISKDEEGNYVLVMEYMREGNLREYLRKNYRKLKFYNNEEPWKNNKLKFLRQITQGLKDIHRKKLVHCDFHSGNIVVDRISCHITDLGLSRPVNETQTENKIYGLMPYMAPEVLKGERYTEKADIYSLGMIMYEVITCLPPYAEQAHDTNLALKILQGIRPEFPDQVKYPQLLVDLIKKCWDNEPNNRPTAREISGIVGGWFEENEWGELKLELKKDTEFYHQLQATEAYNKTLPWRIRYPTYHSSEVWHSKPINTKQITELLTSPGLTLDLSIGNLSIQNPQEESSTQTQIQIPPKNNLN